MLLLEAPKATLTGFHRYNPYIGQGENKGQNNECYKSNQYRLYLEEIGRLREKEDTQTWESFEYASHWSDVSHLAHWNVDNDDLQMRLQAAKKPKAKKMPLKSWLKKNHPELLKQYEKGGNGK